MGWLKSIADFANDILGTSVNADQVGGGLWDAAGAALGGGLSYLGASKEADAATAAAQAQADAMRANAAAAEAAAQPWGVGSLGGTAGFDEYSRTALLNLSPELQNIYSGALERSGLWGSQALALGADPFAAANTFYEQQQQYWDPKEDQLRTDLESRLLAQGRLGTTGGQRTLGELEESIGALQQARRNESMSQAQSLVNELLGRETADIGQAVGLLNIPLQQANLGLGIGGQLGTTAAQAMSARNAAAATRYQPQALSASGTALSGLGGLFLDRLRPQQKS